ncbi:hypothetical protein [Paenibacillus campi]|uniref:hypothetical protein n=1 Tax=Paenibacillus campi TaxID=3106031 RepID=UPI002AFFA719|nr:MULTISPECIES: hypothetical protein [unclassified Paenibacillus]
MMEMFRCVNHPDRAALHQCIQCGKTLCAECYDPAVGGCRDGNHAITPQANRALQPLQPPPPPPRDRPGEIAWKIIVSILAVIGGATLLFLAICGAMIFSY